MIIKRISKISSLLFEVDYNLNLLDASLSTNT